MGELASKTVLIVAITLVVIIEIVLNHNPHDFSTQWKISTGIEISASFDNEQLQSEENRE